MAVWPFIASKQQYQPVAHDEEEQKENHSSKPPGRRPCFHLSIWIAGAAVAILLASLVTTLLLSAAHSSQQDVSGDLDPTVEPSKGQSESDDKTYIASMCPNRHEWRTLSTTDQQAYISAVLCLLDRPSVLLPDGNRTAYSDFPWIHSHVGYFTHNSAPFLPWHRYFLHIYEQTLRKECGYEGSLVYWDWTLDSEALEKSPVFDTESGFGGDGEVGGEVSVGRTGRCLEDGPFAGVTADFYDVRYRPHCVSRGFRDKDGKLGHMDGREISPESIEEVLNLHSYEEFVALMESRVHDAIPYGIGGDFETFTAPYDPLFFLHHTQLDRLWWLWQQRDSESRLTAYGGHRERHSMELATLGDEIQMQDLAPSIKVSQVMDVQGELLCYQY